MVEGDIATSEREVRLVTAARALFAVSRGDVVERDARWAELRDALGAYPLLLVADEGGRWRRLLAGLRAAW